MKYYIQEKFISLGDFYYIKNESGSDIFQVKGNLLTFDKTRRIFTMDEKELGII